MYGKGKALRRRTNFTTTVPDSAGFTLIELLIVIVVLGVLAAVVIFSLGGVTAEAAPPAWDANARSEGNHFAVFVGPKDLTPAASINPKRTPVVDFGWLSVLAKHLIL